MEPGVEETREMTVEERILSIDMQMEDLYKANRQIQLLYPWVLVMVLKREQVLASGIVAPENNQNKPMHEGVVIASWETKIVERGTVSKEGVRLTRCEVLHSELELGDHVLFHHWAGLPIHGYDDKRFRVVRERDWHETQQGGIVAKINYADRNTKAVARLLDMLHLGFMDVLPSERALVEAKIDDAFVVVDREMQGVSLSGA